MFRKLFCLTSTVTRNGRQFNPLFTTTTTCYSSDAKSVTMKIHNGLPHVTIPMPSRSEDCVFVLRPVSQTIGDFIGMLKSEDLGIDRAAVHNRDGSRIASSAPIKTIMDSDFALVINDKRYSVSPPFMRPVEAEEKGVLRPANETDLALYSDIRARVSQIYGVLNINEYIANTEARLLEEVEKPRQELALMKPMFERISIQCTKFADLMMVLYTIPPSFVMGFLFDLTFSIYSWDIVEPLTYFMTSFTAIVMIIYFTVNRHEYVYSTIKYRHWTRKFHKVSQKMNFDVQRYNHLIEEIQQRELALKRLKELKKYGIVGTTANVETV